MTEIRDRLVNGVTVICFSGSIDAMTAPSIKDHINNLISQGQSKLVMDFSGVNFTSSAGLRLLLETARETRSLGGDLRLSALQPGVMKVLDISGFTNFLKLFDDVDGAVASY